MRRKIVALISLVVAMSAMLPMQAQAVAPRETVRAQGIDRIGYLINDNGRCLDLEAGTGRILHIPCHYGDNQIFIFTKDPSANSWEIKPYLFSNQCVDVYNNVGPDLFRHPCHLGANQRWIANGGGTGSWVSYLNNNVLDASGTDLRALCWPYNGAPNQRWTIFDLYPESP
ncbi:RICIN domain-containing protein [Lentzea sp. JNUCC 0626]|uniref:RICIN domain-containing protein n=1 Tax=Lentzea sp. JNUCC 0626 TaxID=3367513 RepID=UPI00374933CC